jgi:hypothetical protein
MMRSAMCASDDWFFTVSPVVCGLQADFSPRATGVLCCLNL